MTRKLGRLSRPIQIAVALALAFGFGFGANRSNIAHAAGKYYYVDPSAACPATYKGHPITACSTTIQGGANLANADGDGDTIDVVPGTYTENVRLYSNDTILGPMDGVPGWCSSANPALVNPNANGSSTLCASGYRQRNNPAVEAVVNGGFNEGTTDLISGFDIEGGLTGPPYTGGDGQGADIWADANGKTFYNILGASPTVGYLCGYSGGNDYLSYNLFEGNLEAFSNFPHAGGAYTCSNTAITNNWFDSNAHTGVWLPSYTGTGTNDGATFNQFTNNARGICLCGFGTGTYTGSLYANYNRYWNNTGGGEVQNASGATATLDTRNSWWGCDAGPNTGGCDAAANTPPGAQTSTPFLTLNVHARSGYPTTINTMQFTQADADMTQTCDEPPNAVGSCPSGAYVANGTPVHWTFASRPVDTSCGTGAAAGGATADSVEVTGHTFISICSGITPGTASVCATVDNATKCYTVTVMQPAGLPCNATTHNLPYVAANSLSGDANHYDAFVARCRSYTPIGFRGDLDSRDYLTPFFINAYGTTGWSAGPGINAARPAYCSSYAANQPYCSLGIDSIVCPGSGFGAQVYGHYTVNGVTRYWLINVNAGSGGSGSFQITAVMYNGTTYTGPPVAANANIQCS